MSAQPAGTPVRARPAAPARTGTPATVPRRSASRKPASPPAAPRAKRSRRAPLRVVRPARGRRRSRAPLLILSGAIIAGLLVGIVSLQALVAQQSFRMQDLQGRTQQLQLQYGELKARAAALSAPSRVAAAARRQGMVLPDASQVQTIRVPGVASSAKGTTQSDVPPSAGLKPIIGEEP